MFSTVSKTLACCFWGKELYDVFKSNFSDHSKQSAKLITSLLTGKWKVLFFTVQPHSCFTSLRYLSFLVWLKYSKCIQMKYRNLFDFFLSSLFVFLNMSCPCTIISSPCYSWLYAFVFSVQLKCQGDDRGEHKLKPETHDILYIHD